VGVISVEKSGTIYNYKMPKGKLTQDQVHKWMVFLSTKSNTLKQQEFKMICEIHAELFGHPYHEPCTCSPKLIKNWIAQINKEYEARNDT
jgi:hypothetical protein